MLRWCVIPLCGVSMLPTYIDRFRLPQFLKVDMRATIPQDVLVSIFQWTDRTMLQALSLASSHFLALADLFLYRRVTIRRPTSVDMFQSSISACGGYRARFVKHLVIAADLDWPSLSSIGLLLQRLGNLHTFIFLHPAVQNIAFRLPPPLPITLRRLQVPHLVLLDRLSGIGAITHLRVENASYYPTRSAKRSSLLLQNIQVLSSGCTLRSIIHFAPMVPNIDCWELYGDGLTLDELNSHRLVNAALASTRVRCLRFVRRSYACDRHFVAHLFDSIAQLRCVEFVFMSSDVGGRVYREDVNKVVSVRWFCMEGQWWQHDWEQDVVIT